VAGPPLELVFVVVVVVVVVEEPAGVLNTQLP